MLVASFTRRCQLAIKTGADIALLKAWAGDLPLTKDVSHGMKLPKSVAFANCEDDITLKEFCKKVKCEGVCWLERGDGIKPNLKQLEEPKGCVSWHPGWRENKYRGRVLAQYILMAARDALETLQEWVRRKYRSKKATRFARRCRFFIANAPLVAATD